MVGIKDMEMPNKCYACGAYVESDQENGGAGGWCGLDEAVETITDDLARVTKPSWCPLVEIDDGVGEPTCEEVMNGDCENNANTIASDEAHDVPGWKNDKMYDALARIIGICVGELRDGIR